MFEKDFSTSCITLRSKPYREIHIVRHFRLQFLYKGGLKLIIRDARIKNYLLFQQFGISVENNYFSFVNLNLNTKVKLLE